MAKKEDLHLGDAVTALRMHDKATSVGGKIVKIHGDSNCVDIENENGGVETVHTDDVTVTEAAKEE